MRGSRKDGFKKGVEKCELEIIKENTYTIAKGVKKDERILT